MPSALIVFASLTGNTEECADIVAESLEEFGVDVKVIDCFQASAHDFLEHDICMVGTYTYGEADLPDEMMDLYDELGEEDLTGKVFGTFGSGDTFYENYCHAVLRFDEQFEKSGATRGSTCVKIELNAQEEDIINLQQFAKNVVHTYENLA